MATPIGTLGNVPVLSVAGVNLVDFTNLLVFFATATDSNYATLRVSGGTAGYQVTGGTTLQMYAGIIWATGTASTVTSLSYYYGDTDIGYNSATKTTTPVGNFGAEPATGTNRSDLIHTGMGLQVVLLGWNTPATKYPNMTAAAGSGVATNLHAYGYEV